MVQLLQLDHPCAKHMIMVLMHLVHSLNHNYLLVKFVAPPSTVWTALHAKYVIFCASLWLPCPKVAAPGESSPQSVVSSCHNGGAGGSMPPLRWPAGRHTPLWPLTAGTPRPRSHEDLHSPPLPPPECYFLTEATATFDHIRQAFQSSFQWRVYHLLLLLHRYCRHSCFTQNRAKLVSPCTYRSVLSVHIKHFPYR